MGGLIAVDQDEVGGRVQRVDSAPHGKHGRLEDINGIDHLFLDHAEADAYGFGPDRQVELFPPPRAQGLGVFHPLDHAACGKDHGGGHDRPRQRPASDLINTRNKLMPCGTKAGFYLCGRQRGDPL